MTLPVEYLGIIGTGFDQTVELTNLKVWQNGLTYLCFRQQDFEPNENTLGIQGRYPDDVIRNVPSECRSTFTKYFAWWHRGKWRQEFMA